MTTSQSEIENKKATLYLIVEDTKEINKKIKENVLQLINDQSVSEELCTLPLFSSFCRSRRKVSAMKQRQELLKDW